MLRTLAVPRETFPIGWEVPEKEFQSIFFSLSSTGAAQYTGSLQSVTCLTVFRKER